MTRPSASEVAYRRYKPWPVIEQFISSLPVGAIGLDSGTGNGKYLPLPLGRPDDILTVGLDRSLNLLKIAQRAGQRRRQEVVVADALDHCWRSGAFDYVISIATIHHLASRERRRRAIEALLKAANPSAGHILIYVWAVDQDTTSKRSIPATNRQDDVNGVDAFVPWVLSPTTTTGREQPNVVGERQVYKRYYHFFAQGELAALANEAACSLGLTIGRPIGVAGTRGVEIVRDSYEKSNFYIEIRMWQT